MSAAVREIKGLIDGVSRFPSPNDTTTPKTYSLIANYSARFAPQKALCMKMQPGHSANWHALALKLR
jgi:hypothetical protein